MGFTKKKRHNTFGLTQGVRGKKRPPRHWHGMFPVKRNSRRMEGEVVAFAGSQIIKGEGKNEAYNDRERKLRSKLGKKVVS